MKIWQSYGAEHSLNLVIIGHFKEVSLAEEFTELVDETAEFLRDIDHFDVEEDRFDPKVMDFLSKQNMYCLTPQQLGHLLYDYSIDRDGNDIKIYSDDDIHGFISLLIHKGAKVEVFSAHDHPEPEQ